MGHTYTCCTDSGVMSKLTPAQKRASRLNETGSPGPEEETLMCDEKDPERRTGIEQLLAERAEHIDSVRWMPAALRCKGSGDGWHAPRHRWSVLWWNTSGLALRNGGPGPPLCAD